MSQPLLNIFGLIIKPPSLLRLLCSELYDKRFILENICSKSRKGEISIFYV